LARESVRCRIATPQQPTNTTSPEQSGQKLYVPVENPDAQPSNHHGKPHRHHSYPPDDSQMQLDDSKYKVYIYNIDDELSSSDTETDDNQLVFLPDIEKHLRASRRSHIPAHVLPRSEPAEGKELVLYRVPSSISVPEEQDSVRKAIIEARARAREREREREKLRVEGGIACGGAEAGTGDDIIDAVADGRCADGC
jgi:hypothetical protein